jgi:hypothetical protein
MLLPITLLLLFCCAGCRPGMECVLVVAATDSSNNLAYYSNWGERVQIAARK